MNADTTITFRYASHKGKRVGIPLNPIPNPSSEDTITDYVSVVENEAVEILEVDKFSYFEIKKICEKADIPLNRVKGLQKPPTFHDLNRNIDLERALEAFYVSFQSSTEDTYRRSFDKLFLHKILQKKYSLEDFIKSDHGNIIKIIKDSTNLSDSLKKRCATAYSSFVKYVSKQIDVTLTIGKSKIHSIAGASKKSKTLTLGEWKAFLAELRKINPRDALIAEVLNYANGFLGVSYKVITLMEVLSLRSSNLDIRHQILTFWRIREGINGCTGLVFPKRITDALSKVSCDSAEFVFTSSKGKPIRENQVKRIFARASKKASIRKVTPTIVRMPIPGYKYCPDCEEECVCI